MARTVKREDHTAKRNEILDVAQRLIYTKGYEQMSIQDILNELHISKGAFYHYYNSKQALLEGIVERTVQQMDQILMSVVNDPGKTALRKFQTCMDLGAQWKTARLDLMYSLLYAWYNDENALARQKITASMYKHVSPWIAEIFRQGAVRGEFTTLSPAQAAQVVLTLMVGMGDAIAMPLLSLTPASTPQQRKAVLREMADICAAYTHAIERFLGIQSGSLEFFSAKRMKQWVNYLPAQAADAAPIARNGRHP